MLRTDLSSIESLRSLRSSVQILLYWFLESVLDRSAKVQGPPYFSEEMTFAECAYPLNSFKIP
jgi:hypothetical protein